MPTGSRIVLRVAAEADIPTPDANQMAFFANSDEADAPHWKDDTGTVHSLQGAEGELDYQNHGNAGAAETVDATTNEVHRLVLDANCTITLTGAAASGTPTVIRVLLVQDATGSRIVTWPGSVVWKHGTAPTLQTAANAIDFVDLLTVDGGTTWYGSQPGERGLPGGAIAIPYTFSTTTTDSDPGAGNLRLNNATQLSATAIRADLVDNLGTTWTDVIDSFDESTNTVKGHIRLFKQSDPTKWITFTVSAVDSSSGYRNITVAVVAGSGANPFAASDLLVLAFTRAGDEGSDGASGSGVPSTCEGRLTLTTAVPVTTADVTAATTLYFTPYKGNNIGTYDGAAWSVNTFAEKSITLATLTAGLPYDVFIVDSTLALELTAWTNATTRATALVLQDGIYVKSGATTRRYLGTICIAATGQSEDSFARRLVWNYYNRVPRLMQIFDGTNTWTWGTTATWRQANATAVNHQVDYVCGVSEDPARVAVYCTSLLGAGNAGAVGVGVDATAANSAQIFHEANVPAADHVVCQAIYRGWPGIGYHYLAWLEYTRAGTMTFEGDNGQADQQSGMVGEVLG